MCFKVQQAEIAQGTVQAVTVVIGFDVLENGLFYGIPCGKSFTVDAFYSQGMEKAFGAGIIIAIAFGTHAALVVSVVDKRGSSIGCHGRNEQSRPWNVYVSRVPFARHHPP